MARWGFDDLVGLTRRSGTRPADRIVFSGLRRDGYDDLYWLDAATGERRRLVARPVPRRRSGVPPRRTARGVFVSDRGPDGESGARNLCLLDLRTGAVTLLTQGPQWDLSPSWSPDGSRLLFVSTRDGGRDLYAIDCLGRGRASSRTRSKGSSIRDGCRRARK